MSATNETIVSNSLPSNWYVEADRDNPNIVKATCNLYHRDRKYVFNFETKTYTYEYKQYDDHRRHIISSDKSTCPFSLDTDRNQIIY